MEHLIHDNIIQNSDEWFDIRRGKITSSMFGTILSKPRKKIDKEAGKMSKSAETYMHNLVAEVLTGITQDMQLSQFEWGKEYEAEARDAYELETFTQVKEIGFIEANEGKFKGRIGASTDGLIGDKGMLEIKNPENSAIHVKYMSTGEIPKGYKIQMYGGLWISDRDWCDFVSYDPRIARLDKRIYIKRFTRKDEEYKKLIKTLEERLLNFIQQLDKLL